MARVGRSRLTGVGNKPALANVIVYQHLEQFEFHRFMALLHADMTLSRSSAVEIL
ncbi:MAG: hypothetical protein M1828_003154 [Chrysothrix sp. TS-e1954]|nr:MAG: hypothetical protein M1828_003154 [Chrysothrix sp. TS-e1954]